MCRHLQIRLVDAVGEFEWLKQSRIGSLMLLSHET